MEMNIDTNVQKTRLSKITAKQTRFLKALQQNNFNISATCQSLGIARSTFYLWRENPEFLTMLEELEETRIDLYEQALHEVVLAGDTRAIIFALKTKGKHRGYVERETGDMQSRNILMKALKGEITTREAAYEIAILGRPLPEVLKLELQRQDPEANDVRNIGATPEELEERYQAAMENKAEQLSKFLPERREKIVELKNSMKSVDSFKPE